MHSEEIITVPFDCGVLKKRDLVHTGLGQSVKLAKVYCNISQIHLRVYKRYQG